MADLVRDKTEIDGPQAFEPDKIRNIGFVSLHNGNPSIHFSGEETKKLADNMGHAIVGKFSHSIPSPHQIQKTLNNIKFARNYSWKFINAKHILIQFDDLTNYARLLSGPKGMPVWYVDRHPMRVFKWSPDFDVFCESPIAAIWCNLIGLPIHLFDTEALFAIGKLLGNPIQVDRATANKSRLSFARRCVEIDITKPPTEEIILDLCGREITQLVRWDKIPTYCLECKHVGHTGSNCYANGKRERPAKRNYNFPPPTHQNNGPNGKSEESNKPGTQMVKNNGNNKGENGHTLYRMPEEPSGSGTKGFLEELPDIMGNHNEEKTTTHDYQAVGRRGTRDGIPSRQDMGLGDDLLLDKGGKGTPGKTRTLWEPATIMEAEAKGTRLSGLGISSGHCAKD